jgi:hypothetical protein
MRSAGSMTSGYGVGRDPLWLLDHPRGHLDAQRLMPDLPGDFAPTGAVARVFFMEFL